MFKTTPRGQEVVLKVVGAGETFAEVVLFEADCYPVTAVAVTPATVLKWLRADVHSLLDDREFRNDFIAMLMRKQRYLADRVRDLATQNPAERLRAFLATNFGPEPRYVVPVRKKQIAAALGITPETFSRLIQWLRRNGGSRLTVLNPCGGAGVLPETRSHPMSVGKQLALAARRICIVGESGLRRTRA